LDDSDFGLPKHVGDVEEAQTGEEVAGGCDAMKGDALTPVGMTAIDYSESVKLASAFRVE
jgi:hypothetical protein